MNSQGSVSIGEDCLAKLDKLIVFLKRAQRNNRLGYDPLSLNLFALFFGHLEVANLIMAKRLADDVRTALGSFKTALREDGVLCIDAGANDSTEVIDGFLDLTWDPPQAITKSHLEVAKDTRSAVLHLLGRAE